MKAHDWSHSHHHLPDISDVWVSMQYLGELLQSKPIKMNGPRLEKLSLGLHCKWWLRYAVL